LQYSVRIVDFVVKQTTLYGMSRVDGAAAHARLEHADILRDDPPRSLRTPPSPRRRCPASDIHYSARSSDGLVAATVPARSSAWAICSATSSRHGAAMICTPMGSGWSGTGTTTAGRPMNEIGWV